MISKNQIKQVKTIHLKKGREEMNLFIAEGVKIAREILQHKPSIVQEVFAVESFYIDNRSLFGKEIKITLVSNEELKKISTQISPNQVLLVCRYLQLPLPDFDFTDNFRFYLDDIRDPGNLGTILRIADWFGMKEIYTSEQSAELYNPKVIQSAMGAFLRVHVHVLPIERILSAGKLSVYGAVLNGKNIYREKLQNGLIIIGNEANGIKKEYLDKITHPITIPSASSNQTESLNAAMAASVICAEFFRQLKM